MFQRQTTRQYDLPTRSPYDDAPSSGFFNRYDIWGMVLGGSALVLWWLLGTPGLGGGSAKSDSAYVSTPAPPPLKAKLFVDSVRVRPTKSGGKRWDWGLKGLPDLHVHVSNQSVGSFIQTPVTNDTLSAVFDFEALSVSEGDTLRIRVLDHDMQFDDVIGERRVNLTRSMLEKGEVEWEFGQVEKLKLVFLPREEKR